MGRTRKIVDNAVIIDRALSLIEISGFEEFSTRKLAAELDISAMTLYNYFENRDAIITQVIIIGFDMFWSGIPEDLDGYSRKTGNPLRVYKLLTEYLINFGLDRPHLYKFLFNSDLGHLRNDPAVYSRYAAVFLFVSRHALPGADMEMIHSDLYMFLVLANSLVLNSIKGRSNMTPELYRKYVNRAYDLCIRPHEPFFRFLSGES